MNSEILPTDRVVEERFASSDAEQLGLAAVAERARQEAERQAIERALLIARWRRTEAARLLKINYRTLLRKMREYGLG